MTGKGCTRMVQTRGARPGVSLLSAKRGEAIGKSWNSYRRDVLYALKAKAEKCKTHEELLALAKEAGYELSDGQLEEISGGVDWSCDDQACESYRPIDHS